MIRMEDGLRKSFMARRFRFGNTTIPQRPRTEKRGIEGA